MGLIGSALFALGDLADRRIRGAVWLSILVTIVALSAPVVGAVLLLSSMRLTGWDQLDSGLAVAGGLVVIVLAFSLFPAVVAAVGGLFADRIADRVEARACPGLVPARAQGLWDSVRIGARFAGLALVANGAALVLAYFIPVLNVIVFWLVNGWLLGRQYYELAALRHLTWPEAVAFRRRHSSAIFASGLMIAPLLAVPVLNLAVPVWATAFAVRVFLGLYRPRERLR